ncbi:hypothetical protein ScPMuIL_010242 [Solemya velum]
MNYYTTPIQCNSAFLYSYSADPPRLGASHRRCDDVITRERQKQPFQAVLSARDYTSAQNRHGSYQTQWAPPATRTVPIVYDASLPDNWTVSKLKQELSARGVAFTTNMKRAHYIMLFKSARRIPTTTSQTLTLYHQGPVRQRNSRIPVGGCHVVLLHRQFRWGTADFPGILHQHQFRSRCLPQHHRPNPAPQPPAEPSSLPTKTLPTTNAAYGDECNSSERVRTSDTDSANQDSRENTEKPDHRLSKSLSLAEFIQAFGVYKNIMCETFPQRRPSWTCMNVISWIWLLNQGLGFYDYHKQFSAKAAAQVLYRNIPVDWSVRNNSLFCNIFSHFHPRHMFLLPQYQPYYCLLSLREFRITIAQIYFFGAPLRPQIPMAAQSAFSGQEVCNNLNSVTGCRRSQCRNLHVCTGCKRNHSQSECPVSKNGSARLSTIHDLPSNLRIIPYGFHSDRGRYIGKVPH